MASEQTAEAKKHDPQTDFDFLIGAWKVHNRKLKERLKGSKSWEEFDGTVVARQVWGGNANIDEYEADSPSGHIQGLTLRLYNPKTQQWSLNWSNSASGTLDTPMIGGFKDGRGEFFDQEFYEGRSIFVRYVWSEITATSCKWEQAFSPDGGRQRSEGEWAISLANLSRKSPQGIFDAKSSAKTQCFRLFVTPLMA